MSQCKATTNLGNPCKVSAKNGEELCTFHKKVLERKPKETVPVFVETKIEIQNNLENEVISLNIFEGFPKSTRLTIHEQRDRNGELYWIGTVLEIPMFNRDGNIKFYFRVSLEDVDKIREYKFDTSDSEYIHCYSRDNKISKRLGEVIVGDRKEGFVIDHKDRDVHNYTRLNLEMITISENSRNRPKKDTISKHKGITYVKQKRLWLMAISIDNVRI